MADSVLLAEITPAAGRARAPPRARDRRRRAGGGRDSPLDVRHVVIAARGSSDNAARYAQYVLGRVQPHHGHARHALALHTLRRAAPHGRRAWSSASRSRDSRRISSPSWRRGAARGARRSRSRMSRGRRCRPVADHTLLLRAGPERSVAATKTYTAQLLTLAMLSAAIGDDDGAAPAGSRRAVARWPRRSRSTPRPWKRPRRC